MPEAPRVEVVPLDEFREPDRNVRSHDEANRAAIAASFRRFGAARSGVVDKDGIVRAGAGSLQGARAAGIKEAVVVDARGDQLVLVRRADWSEEEARAYAITDNRASDLSRFDFGVLAVEVRSLPEIRFEELGWNPADLGLIVEPPPGGPGTERRENVPPPDVPDAALPSAHIRQFQLFFQAADFEVFRGRVEHIMKALGLVSATDAVRVAVEALAREHGHPSDDEPSDS